jgi:DNA-binding SARP family transcriptional activator
LFCGGDPIQLPLSTQRLVGLLALQVGPVRRSYVGSLLWLDAAEERAAASLRSALWKLRILGCDVVGGSRSHLWLLSNVRVDCKELESRCRKVLHNPEVVDVELLGFPRLQQELLPDWYEDWVLIHRERLRQLRVHALESLSERFSAAGIHWAAIDSALAAIAAEPLRERAHLALIKAHVAERNLEQARLDLDRYRKLFVDEMGLAPDPELNQLLKARHSQPSSRRHT